MYKVFAGFKVPEVVIPLAEGIDRLVVIHGGPVVRRRHPLHVTVMAPRVVRDQQRCELEEFARGFNTDYGDVPCRIASLQRFEHGSKRFFVVSLKGQQLSDTIEHFHQELNKRFSFIRRQHEGTKPHITLVSSKHTRRQEVFERVVSAAHGIEYPREQLRLPAIELHIHKEGIEQPHIEAPPHEPQVGWHP
jgi:hypothetical protein